MRFAIGLVAISFVSACVFDGQGVVPDGVDSRLTVLHTADIHSRLFPFDIAPTAGDAKLGLVEGNAPFGGASRLGYLIQRERARSQRSIHLDSGDCFQGAPIFNQNLGEAEVRFLSQMGLDAAVIGNHEFDAGLLNMQRQFASWANFDVLAANYIFPDADNPNKTSLGRQAAPFGIYNTKGLKIAVIGMANLGSLTSIGEGGNSLQVTPTEQNETVRSLVGFLHSQVDLIIVLSHLGLTEDEEIIRGYEKVVWKDRLAPNWTVVEDLGDGRVMAKIPGVRGIDLIVGGHLHVVLNPPKMVTDDDGREVVVMHSGAFSKYLGRLDAVVQDDKEQGGKRIISHKFQVFPVDDRLAGYEDTATNELLEPYLLDLQRALDLNRVIAYAPKDVNRRSATGNGDSGLGNLVAESMRSRRRVAAEFAVTNTLGIRDNFYRGPITLEDMFNVFPFENTLTTMYLSGREVQELADFIAERSASRGCQSQAQVAGLCFTMNCGQVLANQHSSTPYEHPGEGVRIVRRAPPAGQVFSCERDGDAISMDGTYRIAVNDYIANGGSGFRVLKRNTTKIDTGVSLRDALIDFLGTFPRCGAYEAMDAQYCLKPDSFSETVCREIVDCTAYEQAVSEGKVAELPPICQQAGSVRVKGPYADTPCVFGTEDGRLRRKTSDNLDTLPDEHDDGDQP